MLYFNPRTREGCDTLPVDLTCNHFDFNPRTREGCDNDSSSMNHICFYFNPRTREGCDQYLSDGYVTSGISIHAPAKGATLLQKSAAFHLFISIHAPAKGATN